MSALQSPIARATAKDKTAAKSAAANAAAASFAALTAKLDYLSPEGLAHNDKTLASSGVGLTIVVGGKVSGGSVTSTGTITVAGSSATIGTAVSVILSPSIGGGRILWACSTNGDTAQWKFAPAECRH